MTEQQEQMWDALAALEAFAGYYGMRLLDEAFARYSLDEGLMGLEVKVEEGDDGEEQRG